MYDLWARGEALRESISRRLDGADSDAALARQWRWEDATSADMHVPWSRPRWSCNVLQRLDWAVKDCTCECGRRVQRWTLCADCEPKVVARRHEEYLTELRDEVEGLQRQLAHALDRLARAQEEAR